MAHFFTQLNDAGGVFCRGSTKKEGVRAILCGRKIGVTVYLDYNPVLGADEIVIWQNNGANKRVRTKRIRTIVEPAAKPVIQGKRVVRKRLQQPRENAGGA